MTLLRERTAAGPGFQDCMSGVAKAGARTNGTVQMTGMTRDREERFCAMFEGAAIGIGTCNLDGHILESNAALAKMLGYSREELSGIHARELHPVDFQPDETLLAELKRGTRDSFKQESRYRRKDGSYLWGQLTVSVVHDTGGEPVFLIAMLEDATESRRAAEKSRAAEKMEVIGRLAGGIAHDFNNLLTGILLYCDLLSAGLESGGMQSGLLESGAVASGGFDRSELCQHVEEVRMAGEQGAALTHQLLAIARKQAAEPRPIRINEIVASTKNLLQRLIGEQLELVIMLDSGAGLVLADPAQMRQILLNLVLNARDAMPHGGKITLGTRAGEFPKANFASEFTSEISGKAAPGSARRAVSLVVKDDGCGMDAETRARLFEPFFTTKKPGEGTGLGLATVQRIVSESGGMIEVESEPGRGTRIEVLLPAIEASVSGSSITQSAIAVSVNQASPPVQQLRAPDLASETSPKTILLVDDHAAARKSMQRFLVDAGYRILAAHSGKEALNVFAEHSAEVDLLIADIMMPGMNGRELAETLLGQKPDLRVLLISGYEHAPVELPGRFAAGAVELVRKPFSGKALIKRVVEVLQS